MSPIILVVVIIDISVFIDYKDKSRLINNYKSALNWYLDLTWPAWVAP